MKISDDREMHFSESHQKLKKMNALRGIFALEIVIGHVTRSHDSLLFLFGKFMICSVAFFFFVSAYGLVLSSKKDNYLSAKFWVKKPLYLLVLAFINYILNFIIDWLIPYQAGYTNSEVLIGFVNNTNWYVWELILFYVLFWFSYRNLGRYRVHFISIVTLAATVAAWSAGLELKWVASAFAFPFGLAFAEHYDQVVTFLHSVKGVFVTVFLACFGCIAFVADATGLIGMVFMRNAICLATILILIPMCELKIFEVFFFRFLGKYSAELYFAQFIWLRVAAEWSLGIRFIFVTSATLITAIFILHPIFTLVKKVFNTI